MESTCVSSPFKGEHAIPAAADPSAVVYVGLTVPVATWPVAAVLPIMGLGLLYQSGRKYKGARP